MKDNVVTIIIVILIILVIITTCGIVFFMTKDMKKDDNQKLSEVSTNNNFENKTVNTNTNENNNEGNGKNPNGIAMKLSTPKVEKSSIESSDEETKLDQILIDDFSLVISDNLNKNGYEIKLTNNNKVLNITSKDGSYSCKIARFSSIKPFKLSESQEEEMRDIDLENSKELSDFYIENNINRFSSFGGFTEKELKNNVWDLLDINTDDLQWKNDSGRWYDDSLYKTSNSDVHLYELSNEELPFVGLFVKMETYEDGYDSDEVDLWIGFEKDDLFADILPESLHDADIQNFNTPLLNFEGRKYGAFVKVLLDEVIESNEKGDRSISVVMDSEVAEDTGEINKLKNKIEESKDYEVSFDYDNEYIDKVIIK